MYHDKKFTFNSLKTSVLFLIFNRPDTTTQVFEKIRQAKPPRLYIASDGPRDDYENDMKNVKKAREIATRVDWPCEVKTLFRHKNLGCKKGVSSAINWFFEFEEQGIILEDDCVPSLEFFFFCENLLDYYSEDERVAVISGDNFQNKKWRGNESYYFSKYTHCWGWATWRKSWQNFDYDLSFWPKWRNSEDWLSNVSEKIERRYWQKIFDQVFAKQIDSWAYPWTASVWYKGGLTVVPNVNLVSNIGFAEDATHTHSKSSKSSNIPIGELGDIVHPKKVKLDIEADKFVFNNHFGGKNLRLPYRILSPIYLSIKGIIRKLYKNII